MISPMINPIAHSSKGSWYVTEPIVDALDQSNIQALFHPGYLDWCLSILIMRKRLLLWLKNRMDTPLPGIESNA